MDNNDQSKNRRVVGLISNSDCPVPRVALKGVGVTADEVLEEARALGRGHRIIENEELLEQLYRLPIDAPIDTDLFQLVAMLLVHVSQLDQQKEALREGGDEPGFRN